MTKTILFAITLAAVFSVAMVAPVSAASSGFLDIKKAELGEDSYKITTKSAIPKKNAGAFGYGLIDTDTFSVIAVTTHGGVGPDSETQTDAGDGVFHTHLVQLTFENPNCDIAVETASFEEVGEASVRGNTLTVTGITPELAGNTFVSFTLSVPTGDPVDAICVHPVEFFS